jgi:hypothetical protein
MHCGPTMVPEIISQAAEVMPVPPVAEPAPAEGQAPNPFRDETGPPTPPTEMQSPNTTDSGVLEPNSFPAAREAGGADVTVVPPRDRAAEQPMPQGPISGDGFEPMSSANGEPKLEYQSWSASTERDQSPAQLPRFAAENAMPPIVAPERVLVGENASPRNAAAPPIRIAETGSRWRLVIHDDPDGIAADNGDNAPLFRPPGLGSNQPPAPQPQKPAPPKRTLEEQTGDALQRFMSFETTPGANR